MKILIVGKGFIADHLSFGKISERIHPNQIFIDNLLSRYRPDVIINCIGRTGNPNIDWCEQHPVETYTANVMLPLMLAKACQEQSIKMVHLGSGCVFYGEHSPERKEWREDDAAIPLSYYSRTKYACDQLLAPLDNVVTLRLRMPISSKHSPRNLIDKLIKYQEVIDEPNSMTFIDDLVRAVDFVIEKDLKGIYHVVTPEPMTATQIMKEYQKYNPSHQFKTIGLARLNQLTIAPRSNCIISSEKIQAAGFKFQASLEDVVREYCK